MKNEFLSRFINKNKFNGINSINLNKIEYDKIYLLKDIPFILYKKFEEVEEVEIDNFLSKVWNFNEIPITFIETKNNFRIYNSQFFENGKFNFIQYNRINEFLNEFSENEFLNGTIFNKKKFSSKNKVTDYLLKNLNSLISKLSQKISKEDLNTFLLKCFFLKCFSDRNIISDLNFKNKDNLFNQFKIMEKKYNGDLFKINDEENKITCEILELVSNFFKGFDLENNQQVLLSPYDFSIIPIEAISEIYQNLLGQKEQNKNQSFYTPEFLVSHILKKIDLKKDYKILDPSCGSSIFLVKYFKEKVKNIKNYDEAKRLLLESIFGFDVDLNALKISCFSFYIVIIDRFRISEIKNFKFPNLINKNLIEVDFFKPNLEKKINDFDLIIGNPPWGSKLQQKNYIDYCILKNLPIIDRKEISEAFLFRCKDFTNQKTEIILLVKNLIMYSNVKIRTKFLEIFNLIEIEDFSRVRKKIFKNAIAPFLLIRYKNKNNHNNLFIFNVFKNNLLFDNSKFLLLENNNSHKIPEKLLAEKNFNLKIFIDGNIEDYFLLENIKSKNNIKKLLENDIIKVGIQINGGEENNFYEDFLNVPILQKENFSSYFKNERVKNLKRIKDIKNNKGNNRFHRIRIKDLYFGKRLLFQKGNFNMKFENKNLCFTDAIYCIKAERKKLNLIYHILSSDLFKYYSFLTSSKWGIERKEIYLEDILNFPIPEKLDLNNFENIEKDNINKKINNIYNLSKNNLFLIQFIVNEIIPFWEDENYKKELRVFENNLLSKNEKYICEYIEMFFKSILFEFKIGKLNCEIFTTNKFIATKFYYKKDKEKNININENHKLKTILSNIGKITYSKFQEKVFIRKNLTMYDKSSFTIIKPNLRKYWHKKNALDDIIKIRKDIINK